MKTRTLCGWLFPIGLFLGLATTSAAGDPPWAAPEIERAVVVLDGRNGERLSFDDMLDRLAEADVVFLGETHVDETTHRVELAVYEGLLDRRDDGVVLALEMFERDVQDVLDRYLGGEIDEEEFLDQSRPWDQYRTAYRPMVERARRNRLPVVASNMPRPLIRRVAMGGIGLLEDLEPAERAQAPAELLPNSPAYWRRVDNAVRGHLAGMRSSGDDDERLSSTQSLWDNTMGESCALALDAHPGSMVLHVNGAFHSAYRDGTVRQLALRRPDARILTVDVTPARHPAVAELAGVPVADFVVVAEKRATDRNQGTWSVVMDRELDYRFVLPQSAREEAPVPLVVWLGNDGLTSQDGLDLWRDRIGDEVAFAVVEPPYRARLDDLSEGGRWFWPDSFAADIGSLVGATERIWGYLLRYHPIDPTRVVVAGEGTGATVVAAIALLGDRMSHRAVAFEPSRYSKLGDFPLPLPELRGETERTVALTVVGSSDDEPWWRSELAGYRGVGLEAEFFPRTDQARDAEQERVLRRALGLPASSASGPPVATLRVPADTARAWHWARLYGLRHLARLGGSLAVVDPSAVIEGEEVVPEVHPRTLGGALPRCPGPFGGTTVLVVPEGVAEADRQAWIDLEENDPLKAKSRFHRVRVALAGVAGERSLQAKLETLESEGRRNILVVPAQFAAEPETMRALERETRPFADRMTLHWLPGLGGKELPISR
ncbi:MAG: ChaN family lipoprotein [Acidobacteriota bacterium]